MAGTNPSRRRALREEIDGTGSHGRVPPLRTAPRVDRPQGHSLRARRWLTVRAIAPPLTAREPEQAPPATTGITRASYPGSALPREGSRHGRRPRGWSCPKSAVRAVPARLLLLCLLLRSSWLTVETGRQVGIARVHRRGGQPCPCRSMWLLAFQRSTAVDIRVGSRFAGKQVRRGVLGPLLGLVEAVSQTLRGWPIVFAGGVRRW